MQIEMHSIGGQAKKKKKRAHQADYAAHRGDANPSAPWAILIMSGGKDFWRCVRLPLRASEAKWSVARNVISINFVDPRVIIVPDSTGLKLTGEDVINVILTCRTLW